MRARFVLGPAGSGKTFRCLSEIRDALLADPEGSPLVLLAPKQATFQLERQLLTDPALQGYTRLRILSFDRLAEMVLSLTGTPPRELLSAEGRVMVLRALLARLGGELRVFHATARLTGFAQQLGAVLRELQEHQISSARLEALAGRTVTGDRLGDKLYDLAQMLRAYEFWLNNHRLHDTSRLLEFATRALKLNPGAVRLGGLWLDGFAEMTPQELDLVAALVPSSECATLAFCLPGQSLPSEPWLSIWSVNARTCAALQMRLKLQPDVTLTTEALPGVGQATRFVRQPVLAHLEAHWTDPQPFADDALVASALRLVACRDVASEALVAAREIHRFVRAGGRFREVAVLVRSLESYHDMLRRVFRRHGIPCFVDRREPVGHHPLAELTRLALRTVVSGWRHDDWFGVLKTGLMPVAEHELDALENEALARGWQGEQWLKPLPAAEDFDAVKWNRLRERLVKPLAALRDELAVQDWRVDGPGLATVIRALWQRLRVEIQLEEWGAATIKTGSVLPASAHATVWEQAHDLLDNLARAFATERLPLTEWLPILEAGLANLTVGVIPPAVDQVLVGAVDRSRNPDLRLLMVLGMNEGVFPAVPPAPTLLTEADRSALAEAGVELGPDRRRQIGRERYFGYIACTRARERLVMTWSAHDRQGRSLNPSPFIAHLRKLFPAQREEVFSPLPRPNSLLADSPAATQHSTAGVTTPTGSASNIPSDGETGDYRVEHPSELLAAALRGDPVAETVCRRLAASGWAQLEPLRAVAMDQRLSSSSAATLYGGGKLTSSVSRLEQFAACPFRFFVSAGMRAEERELFEVDAKRRGSFQHEVLARFHQELRAVGLRWRDLTPEAAAARIETIGMAVAGEYGAGLFQANDRSVFTARSLTRSLQRFIQTVVHWMRESYGFDPTEVELAFGLPKSQLSAWRLDLGNGRELNLVGQVDRLDVTPFAPGQPTWCVVLDYKSRARSVDPLLLENGIQIQLPAYLAALTRMPAKAESPAMNSLRPAGFFYASWEPKWERGENRRAAEGSDAASAKAYQHRGRFNLEALPMLERQPGSGQFACRRKKDGDPVAGQADPLPSAEFDRLLDRVEERLRKMAAAILDGVAAVDPYQKGTSQRACGTCAYQPICRIDPWTHPYRRLEKSPTSED